MSHILRLGETIIDNPDSNDPAAPPSAAEGPAPSDLGPWGPHDGSAPVPSVAEGRHDGWTGALMAQFCEVLAETGIVVDACLAVGKSTNTAYAHRRRDPLFAGMWEAALGIARNRLADALLARSIEGSVEYHYRDGELVAEKRHIDNRLGLAVLRRLDRLTETGSSLSFRDLPLSLRSEPGRRTAFSPAPVHPERSRAVAALDWDQMIGALRTGEPGAMATALAALKSHETHETHDPRESTGASPATDEESVSENEPLDAPDRVWREHGNWWTDFPPPDGFKDVEHGEWGHHGYKRVCTGDEVALLDAVTRADQAGNRAVEDAERTAYFAEIAVELAAENANDPAPQSRHADPVSASIVAAAAPVTQVDPETSSA
jgi:hypothetical protein